MSDGRKEHGRKLRANRAAEDQATFLRDALLTIEKQKREAAAKNAAEAKAKEEAAQKKAADELAKASRPRKVLVCGDAKGNIAKLFSTVEAQIAKVGPFDVLFSAGSFLPESDETASGIAQYLSGEKKAPLDMYFVDSGAALLHAAPKGTKLCDSIYFLGGYGVKEINGLRVAFLSGHYNCDTYERNDVDFVGGSFTCRAVSELQKLVMDDRKQRGIDILLTSGWPSDLECGIEEEAKKPSAPDGDVLWRKACSKPLAELFSAIEPRYHLFATADVFYERPPFQAPQRKHTCRCIALGSVGSAGKQRKWLHALSLAPMKHMKPADLRQILPSSTQYPFTSGLKRPAGDNGEAPPSKRREVSEWKDDGTLDHVMKALSAGDLAAFAEITPKLQSAVTPCGSAMPVKQAAPKALAQATESKNPDDSYVPLKSLGTEVEQETQEELTEEELAAKKEADEWLSKTPADGVVRYTFSVTGRLGIRLSRDVPPWILEVMDGTLAAKKAPRVPVGGIVKAINGYDVSQSKNEKAVQALAKRPVVLDVEWPTDQGRPTVCRA